MNNKPILIYHSPCPDGFGSAYAFWKKYGDDIEYYPYKHGQDLPDVSGREVYFADIAPSIEDALKIESVAKKITILDHHISRYEELKHLDYYHFNNDKSGAIISWNFLFDEEPPAILKFVQARDIYTWDMPKAKEVLSYLDSLPYSFEAWDNLNFMLESETYLSVRVASEGAAILRYCEVLMDMIIANAYTVRIRGHEVPVVNTPFFRTEILAKLCIDKPFAAGYHYNGERFCFSLRSDPNGLDVSKIAASFPGGGGHERASGFSVQSLEDLDSINIIYPDQEN